MMLRIVRGGAVIWLAGLVWGAAAPRAEAGKWFQRRQAPAAARPAPPPLVPAKLEQPMLGTFYHNPHIMVGGKYPATYGYSPVGMYGDTTLVLYGPLSALRAVTAPVAMYTRGYDGRTVLMEGTATSYPNQPALSPVMYPTQATNAFGFRQSTTPPWWNYGGNWLDQN
jgi:hypothetical protein